MLLTANIDASATNTAIARSAAYANNEHGIWGSQGWAPLRATTAYFDGGGKTINNLKIVGTGDHAGFVSTLEGGTWDRGVMRDLGFVGGSVSSTSRYTGMAVGSGRGARLENVYSTATVSGGRSTGGLVGQLYAALGTTGSAINSYATGSVTGAGEVGGLVGLLSNGSVTQSYATGNVTAQALSLAQAV